MKNSLAVIIVTYNGSGWIRECLKSVFENELEATYDVIVVDNASCDGTPDIVEHDFPRVRVIRSVTNLGFSGGNNIGIKEALRCGHDYMVLLNQDTEFKPDFLAELIKVASPADVGIVQGMLILGSEPSLTNNIGNALHYLGFGFLAHYREPLERWKDREPLEIGFASGAALLVKRAVIEEIGLFDDKLFMYHEDLDLCWRAKMAGYKIMLAPKAWAHHYYEFNRHKEIFYWSECNRWAVLLQNYSVKTLILIAPMLLAIEVMMLCYSMGSGWLGKKLRSYRWVFLHLGVILSRRRQVQSARVVSDRQIINTMECNLDFAEVRNFILRFMVSPISRAYFSILKSLWRY